MHRLRSAISAGQGAAAATSALSIDERRRPDAPVPPADSPHERRRAAQRAAERHRGLVDHAAVTIRRKRALVRVVNVSRGGLTIESGLAPEVGECVTVELRGEPPVAATVRWLRRGRIGLAVGG